MERSDQSMAPAQLDLPTIWKSCTWFPVTFTWLDASTGNPFDLTGWTPVVRSRNINLNPQITNAHGGVVTLSLSQTQTASLKLGVEKWNWIWHDPANVIYPPSFSGSIEIKDAIFPQALIT